MREEVLRMTQVTYQEQGGTLLEDFNLNIFAGEILGLIPVNSHGLTALIGLLRHNSPLKYGYVYYREELINSWHTACPRYNRIGVIQSESSLVDGLTVADNIFVLRPGFRGRLIHQRVLRQQLQPVLDEIGVDISPDSYVEDLTNFQRFVTELVKAVVAGSRLIILRDVSTFISDSELTRLHCILRHYASQGVAFLYIGFHFEELAQICDRTALFVTGRITKILEGQGSFPLATRYDLMVRAQMNQQTEAPKRSTPVLELKNLSGGAVQRFSFSVAPGECVVLQDLQNQMFGDLIALLMGERPVADGGIQLEGKPFVPARSRQIAVIQELPAESMLFPEMTYLDNLCMTIDHRLPELWRSRRVQAGLKKEYGGRFGEHLFDLRPEYLSKKEKYDLVYQRILLQKPKVVFCAQPFNGADLGLRMHIWALLEELIRQNIAVVILAVNLADSLAVADRLVRICRDSPPEIYERREFARIPFSAPWLNFYREER